MNVARLLTAVLLLASAGLAGAQSQEEAIILIAHPAFRDLEYRQTVLIAAPAPSGGGRRVVSPVPGGPNPPG